MLHGRSSTPPESNGPLLFGAAQRSRPTLPQINSRILWRLCAQFSGRKICPQPLGGQVSRAPGPQWSGRHVNKWRFRISALDTRVIDGVTINFASGRTLITGKGLQSYQRYRLQPRAELAALGHTGQVPRSGPWSLSMRVLIQVTGRRPLPSSAAALLPERTRLRRPITFLLRGRAKDSYRRLPPDTVA